MQIGGHDSAQVTSHVMMLHRSASESVFSRTPRTHASMGLDREDGGTSEDVTLALISTPSIRTLPGRSSFTTPRRGSSLRAREPSESTPSSSTSRLTGSQVMKPSPSSFSELPKHHRVLDNAISQQTVLSGSSTTGFSKTAWASENSVADGRNNSRKNAKSSKRQLVLPPSPSDEMDGEYEPIYFTTRGSSSSVKESNSSSAKPVVGNPASPSNQNRRQDGLRSPGAHPDSPKRLSNQSRYHPHNEKFPIPNSPNACKSPSARSQSSRHDDVFDYSHLSHTSPDRKSVPFSGDRRSDVNEESKSQNRRGRKPSREVLLEFPSESNANIRPSGRVAQQTQRAKEERRERVQSHDPYSHQTIRAAHSVPRLDAEKVTTPTNSPDRSTRPHSVVDAREQQRTKSNRGKMCDFFFFFRWGKKKDKPSPSDNDENSRGRSKNSRHRSKSDGSASPSGSRDKHGRARSRSKSRDKKHGSSSDRHDHQHHDQENRHHHHHHHRPSSSSTSRPLRTPTTGGQSSEPQYRQYRHHHRREHRQQQHHHQNTKQHHSPDENRPPPQQYTPSRPKRERPKKNHSRRGRSSGKSPREDSRSLVSDGTVGLRHEDLPLHPSIAKALTPKTQKTPQVTGSYQKNTFVRAPGAATGDQFRRGWKRSRSESPSNLRPSTGNSGSNTNIAGGSSHGGGDGGDLRERSMHSASRTDLDSNFHHTVSSADQRRPSGPPQINRSRSYPGFESPHDVHYFNPDADTKVINDAEDFEFKPTDMTGPIHLSFCGCGFVGMYHLGVVSCLLARGETFLERVEKVAGSSAGALMAAVMLCAPDKIEVSLNLCLLVKLYCVNL